jgi:hypothetical protein
MFSPYDSTALPNASDGLNTDAVECCGEDTMNRSILLFPGDIGKASFEANL